MTITITTAPCCWGVDDVKNPHLPDWRRVLDEAQAAGYGGLELGPYGYMPLDAPRVSAELNARGLAIIAGTIFDDLVTPANRENLLRQTREICSLITQLTPPAPFLTVMDWGHDARDFAAGRPERAPRLSTQDWAGMVETIRAIAQTARDEFGVRAVIHPHAGGYIEFADEIAQIMADIPADLAGLCLDTGHTAYAKMDPVETLERYWDRIDYLHFKDIDRAKYDEVMARDIRFFEARADGVMTPIGDGCLDYPAIHALLRAKGYAGYITVEQERDPRNAGGSLADVKRSRDYLERVGFGQTSPAPSTACSENSEISKQGNLA